MAPDLVDRIYESAFVPELWPGVLGELADIAGARTGFLFVASNNIHGWTASTQSGLEGVAPLVNSGWIMRSERFRRFVNSRHSGFIVDADIYAADEQTDDPFYRDMLYPRGLGCAAATAVHLPTGDSFLISLERERIRGPVEGERIAALDAFRPHLGRGALMSSRMRLEQAGTVSATLSAIGLAAAVLDGACTVLATNPQLDAMSGHLQFRAFGHLGLTDKAADRILKAAVADAGEITRSFPVRGGDGDPHLIAHVVPIRLSARDIFSRSSAVLVLTPVTLPEAAPVELVRSLFDLTPAEARVARSLATGMTVDDIAAYGDVSANTVRAQVRGVLEKTGCGRQVDVVALLTAISASTPS